MRPSRTSLILATTLLLSLASARTDDMRFTATVFDRGAYLRIRLLCEGGVAPDAINARAVVDTAKAGGKELDSHHDPMRLPNETDRPDKRIVAWIDLKAPPKKVTKVDSIDGKLEVLAGGKTREVRVTGFDKKRSTKLKSSELKEAGVEIKSAVKTEEVVRIVAKNGAGRVTGMRMEGTRCDYHSLTDPENSSLVAHAKKARLPKGAVVAIDVKDTAGKTHTFTFDDLKPTKTPQSIGGKKVEDTGVELILTKGQCHLLQIRAKFDDENELQGVTLKSGDRELVHDEIMTWAQTPKKLEVDKSYPELPKDTELVVTLREGAEWVEVPLALRDLPIKRD